MIDWCADFVYDGFWKAVLFLIVCNLISLILSLFFKKLPLIRNLIYWGGSTAAYFTVWNIRDRGGIGWLIFGILGAIGLVASTISILTTKKFKITDENIEAVASGANSNYPLIVNDFLRMEGVRTLPGKVWIYRVTILNTADVSNIVAQLSSSGKQNIAAAIKADKDMKLLRDSDVTIWYEYSDEAGNLQITLKFAPYEYK
jgi:hypothetical protein